MAFDAFLKIEGIPGESTDDKHKDWIEILSYSNGVKQISTGSHSSGGGRSAERADFMDFTISKSIDKASPLLALNCANGRHIPSVKLELCRATGDKQKYMEYVMSDVLVTTVHLGGSSHGSETLPIEEVSFNYGKIEWIYTETDQKTGKAKGNVTKHWDLTANKGG